VVAGHTHWIFEECLHRLFIFYGFVIRLSEKVLEKSSSIVHCLGYGCLLDIPTAFLTAFDGPKRLLSAEKACKIGWNTLSVGLSRLRQGFESPWGRHLKAYGAVRFSA